MPVYGRHATRVARGNVSVNSKTFFKRFVQLVALFTTELNDQYAENLYEDATTDAQAVGDEDEEEAGDIDIESEINDEVQGMRKPQGKPLFTNVRVDVQCGTYQ